MYMDGINDFYDAGFANNNDDIMPRASFENGDFVIKTPNEVQGHETYVNGKHVTHTAGNVYGGENVYHDGELSEISIPNAHGGIDIYNGDMEHQGSYIPDGQGGEIYLSNHGNEDAILRHSDPLAHSSELRMEPFDVEHPIA